MSVLSQNGIDTAYIGDRKDLGDHCQHAKNSKVTLIVMDGRYTKAGRRCLANSKAKERVIKTHILMLSISK